MPPSARVTSLSAAAKREEYLDRVCWYCQGFGYVERIPVKRRGHIFIGPSRVRCVMCDGDGKKREGR